MQTYKWFVVSAFFICGLFGALANAAGPMESDKAAQLAVSPLIEDFAEKRRQWFKQKRRSEPRSVNMLVLSGGGSYGPWGTGVLSGWKQTTGPARPTKFDIVTGVSTGAMIAPFAYITEYLDNNVFPDYVKHAKDIHRKRFILELPFTNSLYSLKPLSKLIARFMKPRDEDKYGYDLLRKVSEVYGGEAPRLLLIGTVGMKSGAFCVWNLGEIAVRARDDRNYSEKDMKMYKRMFHHVLLASAAMPVYHPPVRINFEGVDNPEHVVDNPSECGGGRHIDGGTRRQAFVSVSSDLRRDWGKNKKFNAFVIVNNKLVPPRKCSNKDNLIVNGKRALEILLNEQLIGNLHRLRSELTCLDAEGDECQPVNNFWLSYIPRKERFQYPIDKFPREEMAELRKVGEAWGANPICYDTNGEQPGWCEGILKQETSSLLCPDDSSEQPSFRLEQ